MRIYKKDLEEEYAGNGPGFYHCRVIKVEDSNGEKDGEHYEMWKLTFMDVLVGDEIAYDRLYFTEKNRKFCYKKLKILGMDLESDDYTDVDCNELHGREAILDLEKNEFNGITTLQPKFNSKAGRFGYQEVNEETLKLVSIPENDDIEL